MDLSRGFDANDVGAVRASYGVDAIVIVQAGERRIAYSQQRLYALSLEEVVRLFARELRIGSPRDAVERYVFWRTRVRVLLSDREEILALDLRSWRALLPIVAEVHVIADPMRPNQMLKWTIPYWSIVCEL
ncbi:hypothetical protein EV715DRAFT_298222 [Schizophyllum commune]